MLILFRHFVRFLYKLRGTGLPRLAESIRKIYAKNNPEIKLTIDDFMGKLKFSCHVGEHMGSQIYWRGEYSGAQLAILKDLLRPGSVFIDLGANQGEFSIYAAHLVGKTGQVFSFEPDPRMRLRLNENVSLNQFSQVTIEPYAVSDKPGALDLYTPVKAYEDGTQNAGLPSLYAREGVNAAFASVEVTTLDTWKETRGICHVDVIKLDIEGAELPALRGGENLICRCRPALLIELNEATSQAAGYSMQEIIEWLQGHDYHIFVIEDDDPLSPLAMERLCPFQNILAKPR